MCEKFGFRMNLPQRFDAFVEFGGESLTKKLCDDDADDVDDDADDDDDDADDDDDDAEQQQQHQHQFFRTWTPPAASSNNFTKPLREFSSHVHTFTRHTSHVTRHTSPELLHVNHSASIAIAVLKQLPHVKASPGRWGFGIFCFGFGVMIEHLLDGCSRRIDTQLLNQQLKDSVIKKAAIEHQLRVLCSSKKERCQV